MKMMFKRYAYVLPLLSFGLLFANKPLDARDPFDVFNPSESFWSSYFDGFPKGIASHETSGLSLYEDGKYLVVEANLPGLDMDQIDVTYEAGNLRIEGQRQEQTDEDRNYYHKSSNYYGYNIKIPQKIDESKDPIAHYHNGQMTIKFEKQEKSLPKKIQITEK